MELLTALAIIGLLMALLLPAVQSVREASRRTQCRSNLHNFGVAVAAFESTKNRLPPPAAAMHPSGTSEAHSVHSVLLSYLDQAPVADRIDLQQQPHFIMNVNEPLPTPLDTVVPVFLCPSDGVSKGTNYRINMGAGLKAYKYAENLDYGPFGTLGGMRPSEIIDGLSNTAAMSERIKSDENLSAYSPEDHWYSGAIDVYGPDLTPDELIPICGSLTSAPPDFEPLVGHAWHLASYGSSWYNHTVTPNFDVPDCSYEGLHIILFSTSGIHPARSRHSGGVHVLMLDGSVRFVADNIDLELWRSLGRAADGA